MMINMLFTPWWSICCLHHDDWYVVHAVMINMIHDRPSNSHGLTVRPPVWDTLPPSPGMKHLPPSPGMKHLPPGPLVWNTFPPSPGMKHLPPSPGMKHLPFFPEIPRFARDWSLKVCHNGQYNVYTMATNIMLFINWATCYRMRRESGHVQLHVWTLNLEGHIHILVNKEATYRVVSPLSPRKLKRVTPVKRLLFKNLHRVRINFGGYI